MYALIALGVLGLALAAFFLTRGEKDKKRTTTTTQTLPPPVAVQKDTLTVRDSAQAVGETEYEGEEGEPFGEEYSIANEAYLKTTPSTEGAIAGKLGFGNKIWVDYRSSNPNGYKKVYTTDPAQGTAKPYYVVDYVLVYSGVFDDFKKYFSLPPFSSLGTKVKRLILDNDYSNQTSYEITQNADRAKNTFAYGDYDGDGIMDVAVVLDNNEDQESRLLIICTNKSTKDPYLAYASNYGDKLRINGFKKFSSVYMNGDALENSPQDGVMLQGEGFKHAVIYDNSVQKFHIYNQNPSEGEE